MPEINEVAEQLAKTARDAVYVAVGLAVLGLQRVQVRRQELARRLGEPRGAVVDRIDGVRNEIARQLKAVDEALEEAIDQFEANVEPLEGRLPEQARELVKYLHSYSREARDYVRGILGTAA